MRDASIPAWTTLREPSSSSVAPSEDELQEQGSQEIMARVRGNRPSASTRGAPGASGSRSVGGRSVVRAGPSGTQASGSAAPRHPRPDSSGLARRPLSSDSEEEAVQQPKRKKKRIRNPENDETAKARTRINIQDMPHATQSRRATFGGETTTWRMAQRGGRRTSNRYLLDIASPDREGEDGAGRQPPSVTEASLPNRTAPPVSASAPQLPRPSTLIASLASQKSAGKRRASAPGAPQPHEVIEILDSDDEDVPSPAQPQSERTAPRSRTQATKAQKRPTVTFKEVDGVIVLDDSDDPDDPSNHIVQQPPPAATASTSSRQSPPHGSLEPSAPSPVAQAPLSQHRDPSPTHPSPSSAASIQSPIQSPSPVRPPSPARPTTTQVSPLLSPQQVPPSPIAIEQEDVPMLDDEVVLQLQDDPLAGPEMSADGQEDAASLVQEVQQTRSVVDETVAQTDEPIEAVLPAAKRPPPLTTIDSPSPEEGPPSREDTAALETTSSTLCTASPQEVEPERATPPHVAAPQPQSPAGATMALISRLSSVVLDSVDADDVREGMASPVSSVLDPRLQGLAITGTPVEGSASPEQSSSSTNMTKPPIPSSASRARMRSPKPVPPSSDMLRLTQKRRSSTHRSVVQASPLSPTSAHATAALSTTVSRMSPKPSSPRVIESPPPSATASSAPTQGPIKLTASTNTGTTVEASNIKHDSPNEISAGEATMEVEQEVPGPVMPLGTAAQEVVMESGNVAGQQKGTGVDAVVDQDSTPPESTTKINNGFERSDTAPPECSPDMPLGPSLSQIIRKASNDKARENPIDLTGDDEPVGQTTATVGDKPRPDIQNPSPVMPASETSGTPPLTRLRDIVSARRLLGPAPRSPLVVQQSPLGDEASAVPLPRLASAQSRPQSVPISSTSKSPASAGPSRSSIESIVSSMEPSRGPSGPAAFVDIRDGIFKHVQPSPSKLSTTAGLSQSLPRVPVPEPKPSSKSPPPVAMVGVADGFFIHVRPRVEPPHAPHPAAAASSLKIKIPPLSRPSSAAASPLGTTSVSEHVARISMQERPKESVTSVEHAATPPMSPTEATDVTDEEECRRSLLYPSTTPEDSPEVEIPDDDGHPVRPLSGARNRGQASSEASSSSSAHRRSARLSSGSASSSVEPPDEVEEPRRRLRRRQPIVRTSSEEDIASQGGITRVSRNNKYAQIFEEAGFGSISWRRDKYCIAKEFAPVTQLAENIPHDLHDRLNSLPPSARRAGNMQVLIFEAEIRANTAEDEPNAPPIRIVNNVDDEPTPPLEFYYSNLMWHGKGVPKPDYSALQGCGCIGQCEPSSKTCACVKKHKSYWEGSGFMYDKKGRVKDHEHPIFECNMNCGCSDDCPNRVVQHGRQYEIMIQKTPNKGWGIFAGSKKIPTNTYIGVYAGEYLMDADGEARGRIYNKFGRTYLFDVDFWHIKRDTGHEDARYCIDAYHAGNFTRYLNHSCDPNCAIIAVYINEANIEKPLLAIFTQRDVEPYEEICFSYMGNVDDSDLDSDSDDDGAPKTHNGGVYVRCQCGAANCRGKMWK